VKTEENIGQLVHVMAYIQINIPLYVVNTHILHQHNQRQIQEDLPETETMTEVRRQNQERLDEQIRTDFILDLLRDNITLEELLAQPETRVHDSQLPISRQHRHYLTLNESIPPEEYFLCPVEQLQVLQQKLMHVIETQARMRQISIRDVLMGNTPLVSPPTETETGEAGTTGEQGTYVPDFRQAREDNDDCWGEVGAHKPQ
jgi:hypothetical protein